MSYISGPIPTARNHHSSPTLKVICRPYFRTLWLPCERRSSPKTSISVFCQTLAVLFFITTTSYGQKIILNPGILASDDPEIKAVGELWQSYVSKNTGDTNFDYGAYWNQDEIALGITDIVIAATPFRSYRLSENTVTEIKKVYNEYYLIRNTLSLLKDTIKYFTIIFDVYSKKVGDNYKLFNSFYVNKPSFKNYQTQNINYFYLPSYDFNIEKAQNIALAYSELCKKFGNPNKHKVVYLVGNNLDESYRNIGIHSTPFTSSSHYAGFHIESLNIILSCREDHLHELVHTVFKQYHGSAILQEGIATYYGGTNGISYPQLMIELKRLISDRPDIDLTNYYDLDQKVNNEIFNTCYAIGAIFIDYAFKKNGRKKVLSLFRYEDVDSFDYDGLSAAVENELGIKRNEINNFLREFIINYPDIK